MKKNNKIKTYIDLINHLGGVDKIAEDFKISIRQAYRWRSGEIGIPRKHLPRIQKALGLNRVEILELLDKLNETI